MMTVWYRTVNMAMYMKRGVNILAGEGWRGNGAAMTARRGHADM